MLTPLGQIAYVGILAIIVAAVIAAATGCTALSALDQGIGNRLNPQRAALPPPVDTPLAQFILGGMGALFATALAVYIHQVKRKSASKDELKAHHQRFHNSQT